MKKRLFAMMLTLCMLIGLLPVYAQETWDPFGGQQQVDVVYLGGSQTEAQGWRVRVGEWIDQTYGGLVDGRTIKHHNAGVGGTDSSYAVARLERDVLSYEPDLVFVEFASNDGYSGDLSSTSRQRVLNAMEGIVRRLQSLPQPPIIQFVYTSNSMFLNTKAVHTQVAQYYDIPEVDFVQAMQEAGYEGAPAGSTYDTIPARLKSIYSDITHVNADGHKIWADYMIDKWTQDPQQYFRHARLVAAPMQSGQLGSVTMQYETAKQAGDAGRLSVSGGEDFSFDAAGTLTMRQEGMALSYSFEGGNVAMAVQVDAKDSTVFSYDLKDGTHRGTGSCYYGGEAAAVTFGLSAGAHTLAVEATGPRPEGSAGDCIRVKGFFADTGDAVRYPAAWPEGAYHNTWQQEMPGETDPVKPVSAYGQAISFVTALGLMEQGADGFDETAAVTRGEFAYILSRVCGIGQEDKANRWSEEFFSTLDRDNTLLSPPTGTQTLSFLDVEQDHPYRAAIDAITAIGLMNGKSDTTFAPDEAITTQDAIKLFVDLLGYKMRAGLSGGYPGGYMLVGASLRLTDKLQSPATQAITRAEVAQLIYNATDVEVLRLTQMGASEQYETVPGETLLTEILGLNRLTGVLTDNGVTTLTGRSAVGRDRLRVDGRTLISGGRTNVTGLIGRSVDVYYTNHNNDAGDGTAVYVALSGKDEAVTFAIEDFLSFENGEMVYQQDGEEISLDVKAIPYFIYNGLAVQTFDEQCFAYDSGRVTVISTQRGGEADTVVVEGYHTWLIGGVDPLGRTIYNQISDSDPATDDQSLVVDSNSDDVAVTIVDETGAAVAWKDLHKGQLVDVSRNGNVAHVVVTGNKLAGFTVEEITEDGRFTYITGGGQTYAVPQRYFTLEGSQSLSAGMSYDVSLNSFGQAAWIEGAAGGSYVTAYLIKAIQEKGISGKVQFKIMDDVGNIVVYDAAERVVLEDEDGGKERLENDALFAAIGGYSGLLRYRIDAAEHISGIQIPLDGAAAAVNGRLACFYTLAATDEYIQPSQQFGAHVHIDNNTKIFVKNPDMADSDEGYTVRQASQLVDFKTYVGGAYNTRPGSPYAEYMVLEDNTVGNMEPRPNKNIVIVTKMVAAIDNEGNIGTKAHGFQVGNEGSMAEVELFSPGSITADANGRACSAFDAAVAAAEASDAAAPRYKVAAGDVIRYAQDARGQVCEVQLVFKADMQNPAYPDGTKGALPGTLGYYDATAGGKTNPLSVSSTGTLSDALRFAGGEMRVFYGSVYSLHDTIVSYTSQDLKVEAYDPAGVGGKFLTESVKIPKSIATVTYLRDQVQAGAGSATDIRPWREAGAGCSRVLAFTRSGRVEKLIILNGEPE